jgi:hypothetical protein
MSNYSQFQSSQKNLPDDVSNVGAMPVGISNENCTRRAKAVNSDLLA